VTGREAEVGGGEPEGAAVGSFTGSSRVELGTG
jgi:hypothetical protein